MMDKISVIVPCYNVAKYIDRCLESVISQTYTNLEIIIINDGSTDDTKIHIEKYLSDTRFVYIEQQNKGEFCARNLGIDAATGEYVGFVDADDYIAPDMYEMLWKAIKENQADMAVCNFNLVEENEERQRYAYMPNGVYKIQNDVYGYWTKVCASEKPNNYVWSRLYNRSKLLQSGVRFEKYPHSADTLFNFKLLPKLEKAVFIDEGLYFYVQREESGIHTIALRRNIAELYADTFQALVDYYKESAFEEYYSVLPIHAYTRLRSVFFYSRLARKTDEEIVANLVSGWKNRDILGYLLGNNIH